MLHYYLFSFFVCLFVCVCVCVETTKYHNTSIFACMIQRKLTNFPRIINTRHDVLRIHDVHRNHGVRRNHDVHDVHDDDDGLLQRARILFDYNG